MFNKRFDRLERTKKWPAAWLLLAILVFAFQPLGMVLFCHQDAAHDHASHEHPAATQHYNHSSETLTSAAHPPEHSDETCCSQSDPSPVVPVIVTSYSAPTSKFAASPSQFAVISQVVFLEAAPAIQSRAGPLIPSVVSQLRRSSLLDRAPPLSV